jgi:hypothetical protein
LSKAVINDLVMSLLNGQINTRRRKPPVELRVETMASLNPDTSKPPIYRTAKQAIHALEK